MALVAPRCAHCTVPGMSPNPSSRQPAWEHFAIVYAVCSVLFVIVAALLREPTHLVGILLDLAFSAFGIAVVFGIALATLHAKTKKAGKRVTKFLQEAWHFVMAYAALGVGNVAAALLANSHINPVAALLLGPLAWDLSGLNAPWTFSFFALFSLGVVAWYFRHFLERETESAVGGLFGRLRDLVPDAMRARPTFAKRGERVPDEEPEGATFVETDDRLPGFIIREKELSERIPLAVAELAPKRGKRKREVVVGLPNEGSAVIIGPPGSGKSVTLQQILLNVTPGAPGKFVVTSTKPWDLTLPVVEYLRRIGYAVQVFDTSRTIRGSRAAGDPVFWSPVFSAIDYDESLRIAQTLVHSSHEAGYHSREPFWDQQATGIMATCLYVAHLLDETYEWAIRHSQTWADPENLEIDLELVRHLKDKDTMVALSCQSALTAWETVRRLALEKDEGGAEVKWRRKTGATSATDSNLGATFANVVQEIAKQAALDATNPPADEEASPLDPRVWVRDDKPGVLFLIGNSRHESVSRGLFAPLVADILDQARDYANEQPTQRLPYDLTFIGDELANLAPIPRLANYIATVRSNRIHLLLVFQAYSQLEQVYGREAATTIFTNAALRLVLNGTSDPDLVRALQALGGNAQRPRKGKGGEDDEDQDTKSEPLIDGHTFASLARPNPETGEPGEGLLHTPGGFTKVKLILWPLREPWASRGTVPEQHRANVERLRKTRR